MATKTPITIQRAIPRRTRINRPSHLEFQFKRWGPADYFKHLEISAFKMIKKCCVYGCKSNYKSVKDKVSVFRLPSNREDRLRWLKAIPRDR